MKTLTWSWLETVELKNVGPKRKGRQLITALKKKTKCLLTKQTTKNTLELVKKKKTVELLIVDEEGLI